MRFPKPHMQHNSSCVSYTTAQIEDARSPRLTVYFENQNPYFHAHPHAAWQDLHLSGDGEFWEARLYCSPQETWSSRHTHTHRTLWPFSAPGDWRTRAAITPAPPEPTAFLFLPALPPKATPRSQQTPQARVSHLFTHLEEKAQAVYDILATHTLHICTIAQEFSICSLFPSLAFTSRSTQLMHSYNYHESMTFPEREQLPSSSYPKTFL